MRPASMQAMVMERRGEPLRLAEIPVPEPGPNQILIKVAACGVCRTDLHVFDGELTEPKLRRGGAGRLIDSHSVFSLSSVFGGKNSREPWMRDCPPA